MSFKAVAAKIASKEHLPLGRANAILAKSSRDASPAAKERNPALKRVGMGKPGRKNMGPYQGAAQRLLEAKKNGS